MFVVGLSLLFPPNVPNFCLPSLTTLAIPWAPLLSTFFPAVKGCQEVCWHVGTGHCTQRLLAHRLSVCQAKAPVKDEDKLLSAFAPIGRCFAASFFFGSLGHRFIHLFEEIFDGLRVGFSLFTWVLLAGHELEVDVVVLLQPPFHFSLQASDLGCSNLAGTFQELPGSDICEAILL